MFVKSNTRRIVFLGFVWKQVAGDIVNFHLNVFFFALPESNMGGLNSIREIGENELTNLRWRITKTRT